MVLTEKSLCSPFQNATMRSSFGSPYSQGLPRLWQSLAQNMKFIPSAYASLVFLGMIVSQYQGRSTVLIVGKGLRHIQSYHIAWHQCLATSAFPESSLISDLQLGRIHHLSVAETWRGPTLLCRQGERWGRLHVVKHCMWLSYPLGRSWKPSSYSTDGIPIRQSSPNNLIVSM